MTQSRTPSGNVVPSPTGSSRGHGVAITVAGLVAVVALALLGRLMPDRGPATSDAVPEGSAAPAAPSAVAGFRLVSPVAGTVWLRATEVEIRGVAPLDIRGLDAVIRSDGRLLGELPIRVDRLGGFSGAVPIIPPDVRTSATLVVREAGESGGILAEVSFSVEAGALLLIRDVSELRGAPGSVVVVDVLIYGGLAEVRGLLTSQGGALVTSASKRLLGVAREAGDPPRTLALELKLPVDAPSGRARLHVLGIDDQGSEVEHIDANLQIASGN